MGIEITVSQIAEQVGGEIELQNERSGGSVAGSVITGFAALVESGPSDLSFFGNDRYLADLQSTCAGAVLVPRDFSGESTAGCLIRVDNPSASFGELMKRNMPNARSPEPGVHPSAVVHETARLDASTVSIGPCVTIGENARVGDGSVIKAGAHIGDDCVVGRDSLVHPNASILERCIVGDNVIVHSNVVIGGDGYGFEFVDGRHLKIAQLGIVQIDNDVEIGAGTTIDRARFGKTWIGEGTKIDNLVQVAHNVVVGKHCLLVASVCLAGSVVIGDYVTIAGLSAVSGHVRICSNVLIHGMTGVTKDITEPGAYLGFPAEKVKDAKRNMVMIRKIPKLAERLKAIEKRLGE